MRTNFTLLAAAALALTLSGCGASNSPHASPEPAGTPAARNGVDIEILRGSHHGRILPVASPEALADLMPVVLVGTIESWQAGGVSRDHDEQDFTAVLKVRVGSALKGSGSVVGGFAFVAVPRGGEIVDQAGVPVRNPGAASTVTSLDQLRTAAPSGTRVILFAEELSAGTHLLRAHAQGLLLDDRGALASAGAEGEPWNWLSGGATERRGFAVVAGRVAEYLG